MDQVAKELDYRENSNMNWDLFEYTTEELEQINVERVLKMRTKAISNAKFIITIRSNKSTRGIETTSIFDNRTQEFLTEEYIQGRNVKDFLGIEDMKETLNWNLGGDSSKYQFKWGQSGKSTSEGRAYIFD